MTGPIAWVTGGGSGIGRALAERLYQEGWKVVISGRRTDVLTSAATEIKARSAGGDIWAIPGDVSSPNYSTDLKKSVEERWGSIELLINNAGVNPNHPFQETLPEEYLENFKINCLAAIQCTRAVLPPMLKKGSGTIVNISSVLGKWASAGSPAYSVSKYALAGFNDVLRQELSGSGVHVLGVYPGFIRTAMTLPFVEPGSLRERVGKTPDSMARAILRAVRLKKQEVNFPWYVSIVIGLHQLLPGFMESLRKRTGH